MIPLALALLLITSPALAVETGDVLNMTASLRKLVEENQKLLKERAELLQQIKNLKAQITIERTRK